MQALWTMLYTLAAGATARSMYQQWRVRIIQHDRTVYPRPSQTASKCVWAAIASLFICLMCWWIVLAVMLIMARPKRAPEEIREAENLQHQKITDLEREAENLRAQLAKLRSEHVDAPDE